MKLQATNDFVFIVRSEAENEVGGLLLPDSAKKKTNNGKILSVGDSVQDKKIKGGVNKIAVFHEGVGFSIDEDGNELLVLRGGEIIGIK